MKCIIYDFETLGQKPRENAVLSLAMVDYNDAKFIEGDGYDYDELLAATKYIKFDVADQVKHHGKTIDPNTLEWWKGQGETAKKVLKPSESDQSIADLRQWILTHFPNPEKYAKVYTRGNTFDPMFLDALGADVFSWWAIRDTRSYIDGMLLGAEDPDNRFVPKEYADKFVAHDARHDIVMDIMRMQVLHRAILL